MPITVSIANGNPARNVGEGKTGFDLKSSPRFNPEANAGPRLSLDINRHKFRHDH